MTQVTIEEISKKASELPTISPAVIEMINIIDDPSTPIKDIVYLVSVDEVLCADVFRYVGSAAFGYNRKVENIDDAISLIGLNEIKNLAFMIAAKSTITDAELWYHSVFAAVAGFELGKKLDLSRSVCDDIYMAGLLHAFGSLVFRIGFRDLFKKVLEENDKGKRLELEKEIFGIDHIDITVELLENWGVPERVLEIIRNHQKPWNKGYNQNNAIIELTSSLEDLEFADDDEIYDEMNHTFLREYGLDELKLDSEAIKEIHNKVQELINF